MQHFNKYGIAALMLLLGTAMPAVAQEEEVQQEEEVVAPVKKIGNL